MNEMPAKEKRECLVGDNGVGMFYLFKYIDKFGCAALACVMIWDFFEKGFFDFGFFMILFALCLFMYLLVLMMFLNFAYKVKFDPEKEEFSFYMIRKKDTKAKTREIESIFCFNNITFRLSDGRKIKFRDYNDVPFVKALNEIKPIKWGMLTKAFQKECGVID